jgi:hypothetical protein
MPGHRAFLADLTKRVNLFNAGAKGRAAVKESEQS